jgi:hypothetical protein
MTEQEKRDKYFAELEEKAEQAEQDAYNYGGGYEASKGDYEGACLARAEYESGVFS